jgi:hypothetical protein
MIEDSCRRALDSGGLSMSKSLAFPLVMLLVTLTMLQGGDQVVHFNDNLRPLNMPPTYTNGHVAVHDLTGISVYRSDGQLRYKVPLSVTRGTRNVANDKDGTLATAIDRAGEGGHVAVFDPSGSLVRMIEIPDLEPSSVVFAPDHSMWVTVVRRPVSAEAAADYGLLRHYSPEGELLGSFLPRSSFDSVDEPIQVVTALPDVHWANDRIAVYLKARTNHKSYWVEASPSGKELGRWAVPRDIVPRGLTSSGRAYAQGMGQLYVLDRSRSAWVPMAGATLGTLIGIDGGRLVFADRTRPAVSFVPEPSGF